MSAGSLTFRSLRARPVVLKLQRPIVARIATITHWPLILIDLETDEGIVGRSYLEPYTPKAMPYLVAALHDFADLLKGRAVSPLELYAAARKSLHFVGYQGLSTIAVSGLDMAAWDALAKAAGMPLCVLLGGSVGAVDAYNSNGLWLRDPERVARRRSRSARVSHPRSFATKAASTGSSFGLDASVCVTISRRSRPSAARWVTTCT